VKVIGIIVLLLVIGLGAVTLFVTKEPSRELDAQGKSWVAGYETWHDSVAREVTAAQRGMTLTTEEKNARLLEPLRGCERALTRIGEPPSLLEPVHDAAQQACGQAAVALAKNDQFGTSALATTRLHLAEVEDNLRLAQHSLKLALDEPL
jgi:hypothetical protein